MPTVGAFCHFVVLYAYSRIVVSVRDSEFLWSVRYVNSSSDRCVNSWFCMPIVGAFLSLRGYVRL